MNKLILVSNRLPIEVSEGAHGPVIKPGSGGLASAVGRLSKKKQASWVGYLGNAHSQAVIDAAHDNHFYPVDIPPAVYKRYYSHFSNRVLWPILHGLEPYGDPSIGWEEYMAANLAFADEVVRIAEPDDVIWVHDYHLFMLPKLLRQRGLNNKIGFFLHTPFPGHGFFTDNLFGRRLLESLSLADTVGVQTTRYLDRLNIAFRNLGARVDYAKHSISLLGRKVLTGAFPIGIDYRYFNRRPEPAESFKERLRPRSGARLMLALSRLDYTKGIPQLLDAVRLLAANPAISGKFTLMLVVIPSREAQPEYQNLKRKIERRVKSLNDKYARNGWRPVEYLYGSLNRDQLLATYRQADIMLNTPIADGMNLVAKEYLAANTRGILILSRAAGAADQLSEALLVDPNDPADIARVTAQALEMGPASAAGRRLRRIVRQQNVYTWADDFLSTLAPEPERVPAGAGADSR